MSKICVVARVTIGEGKLEAFLAAAEKAFTTVSEKDTGTLQYDWYMSPDKTTCTVLETYESSEAVMSHMGNVQESLGALMGIGTLEIEVFGTPSDELKAAAAAMEPKLWAPLHVLAK